MGCRPALHRGCIPVLTLTATLSAWVAVEVEVKWRKRSRRSLTPDVATVGKVSIRHWRALTSPDKPSRTLEKPLAAGPKRPSAFSLKLKFNVVPRPGQGYRCLTN